MKLKWLAMLSVMAPVLMAAADEPARYRDFKVYTTSAPDPADPSRIVATMRLLNDGELPLELRVRLGGNPAVGLAEVPTQGKTIPPKTEDVLTFDFKPPEGLKYEVIHGMITFGDRRAAPARDLYIAVHGPDPADFADKRVERITAKAQVVGTFTERRQQGARLDTRYRPKGPAPAGPALELASAGESKYQIEFDAKANPEAADAVADLQNCVKRMSGASPAVVPSVANGPAIRVRRLATPPANWTHPEAYHLHVNGDDVLIEATTADGLRNGVYGLLTDYLDCHWFMPKQLGEEFPAPADRTIRVRRMDETRGPSFFSSPGMSWGSAPRWDRQNRAVINRGRMNFGHAWQGMIDTAKYPYDKFPDMWSRDRSGKVQVFDSNWSATNFCSTNPQVIEIVAEKINTQFDANPDAIVASIDPNDLAPLCQCDRCLALDAKYGVKPTDDKQMADRLLHFSKEIHDRLKPAHKKKFLGILAYGFQTRPPKSAVPHAHHAATVCQFPSYFDHTRPFNDPTSSYNREFFEIVKGWGARMKQLGFYDYYGHYNFFGPWGILHKIREDLPAFKEMGGTFVVIESQPNFAMHGLNLYVAARLLWDIDADVDVVVEEYVTKFYGPAADPMQEFFRAAERQYALTRPGTQAAIRVGERPEFWQELDGYLKQAEEKVQGLAEADKRYAERIAFTRDGFAFGKLMADAERRQSDVAFLKSMKAEIDRMKAKYPGTDEKYPTLTPSYFWPDMDAMLKKAGG